MRPCISDRRRRGLLLLGLVAAAAVAAAPAAAQETGEGRVIYRREVFEYRRDGRPDPFRAPAPAAAQRLPITEVTLRGVVYDADPRESVAILMVVGRERSIRARVGERVGGMRVVAIHPLRVDLLVEEAGAVRQESLHLRPAPAARGDSQ